MTTKSEGTKSEGMKGDRITTLQQEEPRVVLSLPDMENDTGAPGNQLLTTMKIARPDDRLRLPPAGKRRTPSTRRVPMWPVAAAMVAGAFIALSSQAMIQKPLRRIATAPAPSIAKPVVLALRPVPAVEPPSDGRAAAASSSATGSTESSAPLSETGRTRRRSAQPSKRRAPPSSSDAPSGRVQTEHSELAAAPAARAREATVWVDPFAGEPAKRLAAPTEPPHADPLESPVASPPQATTHVVPKTATQGPSEAASKTAPKAISKRAWVDPFAN